MRRDKSDPQKNIEQFAASTELSERQAEILVRVETEKGRYDTENDAINAVARKMKLKPSTVENDYRQGLEKFGQFLGDEIDSDGTDGLKERHNLANPDVDVECSECPAKTVKVVDRGKLGDALVCAYCGKTLDFI